jgi:DNA-binding NarL/FixJ family response regulator
MKEAVGLLTGIARPIPEVATFVTPVFRSRKGGTIVQRVDENGLVAGFAPITVGEEFESLSAHHLVFTNDPALFGFELGHGRIALGSAHGLADLLTEPETLGPSPGTIHRATRAAIRRFIESAARSRLSESSYSFVVRCHDGPSKFDAETWRQQFSRAWEFKVRLEHEEPAKDGQFGRPAANSLAEANDSDASARPGKSQSEKRTRVLLAEGHAILRAGLRALLELESDLEVAGHSANGTDAVALVQLLSPALIITDITLPDRSGTDLISSLREAQPDLKILVLTAHNSEEYVRMALRAGADGYVLKDVSRAELLHAVRTVLSGHTYLSASARVVSGLLHRSAKDSAESVTDREREILTRVALGESNKLIARRLGVSVKTVEIHRANLMRKLTLHNTAAVTRFAISHGMLTIDDLLERT